MVEILNYLKMCLEIIFCQNYLFHSSKEVFLQNLRQFLKIEFLTEIDSRRPYKNDENFELSQNVLRKYFLAKLFVPLIKRSVSAKFKAVFGKLSF